METIKTGFSLMLSVCLVAAGCALPQAPAENPKHTPSCAVGILLAGRDQVSTVFKLKIDNNVAYLTTAHSLPSKPKDMSVIFRCNGAMAEQPVLTSESLPGLDVALLGLPGPLLGMPALKPERATTERIRIPHYPNMSALDPRLAEMAIEIDGKIFGEKGGRIYYTATPIRIGASGAPVLNENGRVVGISVGRLMDGNIFSGIGYGETIERVLTALAIRDRSGNRNATGSMLDNVATNAF